MPPLKMSMHALCQNRGWRDTADSWCITIALDASPTYRVELVGYTRSTACNLSEQHTYASQIPRLLFTQMKPPRGWLTEISANGTNMTLRCAVGRTLIPSP